MALIPQYRLYFMLLEIHFKTLDSWKKIMNLTKYVYFSGWRDWGLGGCWGRAEIVTLIRSVSNGYPIGLASQRKTLNWWILRILWSAKQVLTENFKVGFPFPLKPEKIYTFSPSPIFTFFPFLSFKHFTVRHYIASVVGFKWKLNMGYFICEGIYFCGITFEKNRK